MPVVSARGIFWKRYRRLDTWVRANPVKTVLALGFVDLLLVYIVILRTVYTEIDWTTYMQQVDVFLHGERDYMKIRGPTGPLVYPANFLYIFSFLREMTEGGTNIRQAQLIFGALHAINVMVVARMYLEDQRIPFPLLLLLLASRRVISIYALRLFNDGIEALLANVALLLIVRKKYRAGCIALSLAVGVKMNGLLYAPALGIVMIQELGRSQAYANVALCIAVQGVLAVPFLLHSWRSYMSRAFELGRVFLHEWTVNYAFLSEEHFQSRTLAVILLAAHLLILLLFTESVWAPEFGGVLGLLGLRGPVSESNGASGYYRRTGSVYLPPERVLTVLLTCNLVGITFARSIHYQFYAWYFHSLPFLLWKTALPVPLRLLLFFAIEIVYNIYPPHPVASGILHVCHLVLLYALYLGDLPQPTNTSVAGKKAN